MSVFISLPIYVKVYDINDVIFVFVYVVKLATGNETTVDIVSIF